jgi:hypothetical protein
MSIAMTGTAQAGVVTSEANSGAGSLRQVVADEPPGGTITFAANANEINVFSPAIVISKDLTIRGNGIAQTQISGIDDPDSNGRGFVIGAGFPDSTVRFENLKIWGFFGETDFGNQGADGGDGGAIANFANLTLTGVEMATNEAGAGVGNTGVGAESGDGGNGGAIANEPSGNLTIRSSRFLTNTAGPPGQGQSGSIGGRGGGGGAIFSEGTLDIANSDFENNIAGDARSGFLTDHQGSGGKGGAIQIAGNGTAIIRNTLFRRNEAGGSVDADAGVGGAIHSTGTSMQLVNSTLTGNQILTGMDAANHGRGGAIATEDSADTLINNTIINNNNDPGVSTTPYAVREGGGVKIFNGGSMSLRNTILAHNAAASGPQCSNDGLISNIGGNFSFPAAGACPGMTAVDPGVSRALAANGGPTLTHALLAGAAAIDAAATCPDITGSLTTDQRGLPRPSGPACDSGAFELQKTVVATTAAENAECEPLRQKIKKLTKKIKKATDPEIKAKLKKKRRKARKLLAELGCSA